MRTLTASLAGLALCVLLGSVHADDAISSDRPDLADSPDVVGRGRLQLELGLNGENSKIQGQKLRALSTPFLLRLGLSENWELRLDGDGWQNSHASNAPGAHGWGDLGLGAKWHLSDGDADKGLPAMALIGTVTYATGSAAFRGQGSRPEL
ncbi:MAG: transporter, partial [Burkholderiaceae bacterium]